MIFVHENNFNTKIKRNYKKKAEELTAFKDNQYASFRKGMLDIDFSMPSIRTFKKVAKLANDYYEELSAFIKKNGITAQSKLESTFLEELSVYLFKDIPEIKENKLDFYNKGVYAGLKINPDLSLDIIKKDVDFCIGMKVRLSIEKQSAITLTIPLVSVEVKTYMDATMFGEIKSSSKTLKSATPNSKAYVLMGYNQAAIEHILAARQDSTLDEIFVLRENANAPIDAYTLYLYWQEIISSIEEITTHRIIKVPGRLLAYNNLREKMISEMNE